MIVSQADRAAADLHALIVKAAEEGPLAGVEAEVAVMSGRRLRVTLIQLPWGAVEHGPQGLAPTIVGARITELLHMLARRACNRARITGRTEFRVSPAALAAAASTPSNFRRAS